MYMHSMDVTNQIKTSIWLENLTYKHVQYIRIRQITQQEIYQSSAYRLKPDQQWSIDKQDQ